MIGIVDKKEGGEKMKRICFVIGNNYSNIYESCIGFLSRNYLNDMLLLDFNKTLERIHYKSKVNINYDKWYSSLSEMDKFLLFEKILEERLKDNDEIDDIMITGSLNYDEIIRIVTRNNIQNFNIIVVDISKELSYRNYTYDLKRKISYDEFDKIFDIDKRNIDNLKTLLGKNNYSFQTHYRKNNNDNLDDYIAHFFGMKTLNKSEETYEWPVVPKYKLLEHDKYGLRTVHMILGKPKFHSGFDITTETNTEVKASISGVVTYAGFDERIFTGESKWDQRYGNVIEVLDNYGRKQLYAHLRNILVKKGEFIKGGDLIGLTGCSGGARVPHLHFEIRKYNTEHSGENNTINPLILLPQHDFTEERFTEKPYDEVWEMMSQNPFSITDNDIPYAKCKKYIR